MEERNYTSKRTIEKALENVGDRERLAKLLGAELTDLNRWMLGKELPPYDVFLRALDLAFKASMPVAPLAKPGDPRADGDRTA